MTRSLRDDDGANAVEFALVLPILVMLLFGAISFGLAFNQKQQMEHANRESVRFAATLPGAADEAWFEDVVERMVVTGAGQTPLTDPSLKVCISAGPSGGSADRFDGSGGPGTTTPEAFVTPGSISTGAAHCHNDTMTGHTVQVEISRDVRLDAVFFIRDPVTLSTDGVALYEETEE